jgi:outer membrane protein assembly factor BamE
MTRKSLALLPLVLLGACGSFGLPDIRPHRIDVQQGNAIDQETVAKLKPGLNRAQVRFLMGTPLLTDPFHPERWDYVYTYYKAGQLAEQKRVTLFFDGDILTRIESNLPAAQPAAAEGAPAAPAATAAANTQPTAPAATTPATSLVAPLPSPKGAPAYVDPRPPIEPGLVLETEVAKIQPDVIPPFPDPQPATPQPQAAPEAAVLDAVTAWAKAWQARNVEAYLGAYAADFAPAGGGSRAEWEKRRRALLDAARQIELKIDSPSVEIGPDGTATVTFNQFYRSDRYRDAVVKQLRLALRDGRWQIIEERVVSPLRVKRS